MSATAPSASPHPVAAAAAPAPPAPATGPSKREIEITENAAVEIAKQRAKRGSPDAMIRIGVRGGGCTGFTYVFEWAEKAQIRPSDKVFSAHGVSIVIDPKSLVYLGGMQLDFVRGMMGHGFKFNNPNAKGSCGCGESVQF
jgi:iron-sulfur cluster assembly protein